jgi:hypothetical protein
MVVQRWTIRGVDRRVVDDVRVVQAETGASLGQVVTMALDLGLPTAARTLRNARSEPADVHRDLQQFAVELRKALLTTQMLIEAAVSTSVGQQAHFRPDQGRVESVRTSFDSPSLFTQRFSTVLWTPTRDGDSPNEDV